MVTTVLTGAKRAVCYRRVSSAGQTGERHSSLETQESQYLKYCDTRNYIPVRTFQDVVSGRRDDRREYLQMVDFVMQGGAEVVVVQFFDRFGFRVEEWQRLAEALRIHGASHEAIRVVETSYGTRYSVDGALETPDRRNPRVRTIWIVDSGSDTPRLITAHPLRR